jgi:hypothetical protein
MGKTSGAARTTLNLLAARAEALRSFDALPDDALVGYRELAILEGRSEDTLRQARRLGRLPIPRHGSSGKLLRFRVGDVRLYLRGGLSAA